MKEADLSTRPMPSACSRERRSVHIGLDDLMIAVVGAGIVAFACREMRPWEWSWKTLDVDQGLGLTSIALAILCGTGLLRQAIAMRRRRCEPGEGLPTRAIAWRLTVVFLLIVAYPVVEAPVLRDDPGNVRRTDYALEVQRRLVPLSATFAMIGLLAGLRSGTGRTRSRGRRGTWPSVVWAVVAGIAIAATQSLIPYLVLLALEAVSNAMPRLGAMKVGRTGAGLHERILSTGLAGIPALVSTLILALLVSRSLRSPAHATVAAGRRGPLLLLIASAATAIASAWLCLDAFSMLHASLAEGISTTLVPGDAAFVVLGFAGLALGPALLTADRAESPATAEEAGRPRALGRRVLRAAMVLILLGVIVTVAIAAGGSGAFSWLIGPRWVDAALNGWWSFASRQSWMLLLSPQWIVLIMAEAWVGYQAARLHGTTARPGATAIDVCLENRPALGRFAVRWLALTVLMVASLPVFFVAGLALLDGIFRTLG